MPWPGRGTCSRDMRMSKHVCTPRSTAVLGADRLPDAGDVPAFSFIRAWCSPNRCGCILLPGCSARVAVEEHEVRGYVVPARIAGRSQPVGRSPEQRVVSRAGAIRSRSVARGGPRRPSAIFIFPVRRRNARMHGRGICVDGRRAAAGRHCAALALSPARRIVTSPRCIRD